MLAPGKQSASFSYAGLALAPLDGEWPPCDSAEASRTFTLEFLTTFLVWTFQYIFCVISSSSTFYSDKQLRIQTYRHLFQNTRSIAIRTPPHTFTIGPIIKWLRHKSV